MKKKLFLIFISTMIFFTACKSTQITEKEPVSGTAVTQNFSSETEAETVFEKGNNVHTEADQKQNQEKQTENNKITLLFAGDIMAHEENYKISSFSKIYSDIEYLINDADLSFANIEAPVNSTNERSTYPNFNMPEQYVEAAINAGFDVFSLCNNHCNDQGLEGIKETIKSTENITEKNKKNGKNVYFSGLKENSSDIYSCNMIEINGWKILFLPVTELLNRQNNSGYINYVKTTPEARDAFTKYVKKLRDENECDLFVLSLHTSEPEYTRVVKQSQKDFYKALLDAGVDVLWANHAHIIKDREFVFNSEKSTQKLIMYANGNTISGQRRKPDLEAKYPDYERDNTGDGIFYYVTFKKGNDSTPLQIINANHVYITTYINTANEFVLKPMNDDFIDYLYEVSRDNWAEYIKKRIMINDEKTKDLITWQ